MAGHDTPTRNELFGQPLSGIGALIPPKALSAMQPKIERDGAQHRCDALSYVGGGLPMQSDWRKAMADIKGNYARIPLVPGETLPANCRPQVGHPGGPPAFNRESYAALERDVLRISGIPGEFGYDWKAAALSAQARIAQLEAQRDGWQASAAQFHRNECYYRGLLDQIGEHLGPDAFTQDDGGLVDEPLRAKLPELVARLRTEVESLRVEKRYVEGLLKARAPDLIREGPQPMTVRTDVAEAVADALVSGTGWLRVTRPEPEPPSTATHAKPFPAKAMR
jgi:hypothetical protein